MSLIAISYPKLSQKDFDSIQLLRKKYDNNGYNLLDAHITFVFPIERNKKIGQIEFLKHNKCKWFIFLVSEERK